MSETSQAIRTDHPQGFKPPWGVKPLLVLGCQNLLLPVRRAPVKPEKMSFEKYLFPHRGRT